MHFLHKRVSISFTIFYNYCDYKILIVICRDELSLIYSTAYSGEGYKIAIHNHMDQPIMSLSDIDLSPGFVTQLSVTPTLHETTSQGKKIIVDMIKIMKYKSILYI